MNNGSSNLSTGQGDAYVDEQVRQLQQLQQIQHPQLHQQQEHNLSSNISLYQRMLSSVGNSTLDQQLSALASMQFPMGGMSMGGMPMVGGGMSRGGMPMGGMPMGGMPMGGMSMGGMSMGGMSMIPVQSLLDSTWGLARFPSHLPPQSTILQMPQFAQNPQVSQSMLQMMPAMSGTQSVPTTQSNQNPLLPSSGITANASYNPEAVSLTEAEQQTVSHPVSFHDDSQYHDYTKDPHANDLDDFPGSHRTNSFPSKLHRILSDSEFADCISWLPHGRSWKVVNQEEFEERVIPLFFRHAKFASFMRQVNGWGFRRYPTGVNRNSYYHEMFLRGFPHLCSKIVRPVEKIKANSYRKAHPDFEDSELFPPLPGLEEVEDLPQDPSEETNPAAHSPDHAGIRSSESGDSVPMGNLENGTRPKKTCGNADVTRSDHDTSNWEESDEKASGSDKCSSENGSETGSSNPTDDSNSGPLKSSVVSKSSSDRSKRKREGEGELLHAASEVDTSWNKRDDHGKQAKIART